ncbi:hypothetical protein PWT90_01397 [Aphanocladium album]|nr:hypothetical protein PWT90_01397 [Aphanocladium album]
MASTVAAGSSATTKTSINGLNQKTQSILILNGPQQRYELIAGHSIPALRDNTEVLVQTQVIGLNPIDWKSPQVSSSPATIQLKPNQVSVIVISTDYRDARKAAYQEFVAALSYNVVKLPRQVSSEQGAALGVAFVTSALALGSCFGISFSDIMDGPDLTAIIRNVGEDRIPEDVRHQALRSIHDHERALEGDWVAIWGGSATSAYLSIQLARLAGLKVAVIVDQARHGFWLSNDSHARPDLLVDNSDPNRAVEILSATLGDKLYFGIDTNGTASASYLLQALRRPSRQNQSPSPPPTPPSRTERRAHLLGLAGLPKTEYSKDLQMHAVPLKLFHDVPEVGRALTEWMERLLHSGQLRAPRILGNHFGLADVNKALDRMRNGEIRGGKLVVTI